MNSAAVIKLLQEMNQEFKADNDKAEQRYIDVEYFDSKFAVEVKGDKVVGIYCDGDLRYLLKPEIEEQLVDSTYIQRRGSSKVAEQV